LSNSLTTLVLICLADLAAQGGLRQLRNREAVVGDPVGRQVRIHHLHVQHCIDAHLHVVAGDADLFGNVDRDFFETVLVGDALHERHENMKAGRQRAAVFAQVFDHEGALLRHHRRGLGNHHHDQYGDDDGSIAQGHIHEFSPCTTRVKPLTRSIRAR
jgi:hypothetical protein